MEILVNSGFAVVCRVGEITLQYMFLPGFKENVKPPSFVLFLCKQEEEWTPLTHDCVCTLSAWCGVGYQTNQLLVESCIQQPSSYRNYYHLPSCRPGCWWMLRCCVYMSVLFKTHWGMQGTVSNEFKASPNCLFHFGHRNGGLTMMPRLVSNSQVEEVIVTLASEILALEACMNHPPWPAVMSKFFLKWKEIMKHLMVCGSLFI